MTNEIKFDVRRNKRKSPEDFSMESPCNGCSNYVEYSALVIVNNIPLIKLCKSCLTKGIETIDKQAIEDMKK